MLNVAGYGWLWLQHLLCGSALRLAGLAGLCVFWPLCLCLNCVAVCDAVGCHYHVADILFLNAAEAINLLQCWLAYTYSLKK